MNTLIVATSNLNKLKELREMLLGVEVLGLKDLDIFEEIPETGATLEENALIKARYLFDIIQKPVMAEDTGLEVSSLGGAPGVYSARYAGPNNDPEANMNKLLDNLKDKDDRKARFRTVIAYISNDEELLFEGVVNGHISHEKMGHEGFGYDPIFIPEGFDMSFAQMDKYKKNEISHRGRALRNFLNRLNSDSIKT